MATFRDTVEKATVTIWKEGESGRGVLVDGNLILTAAHCIDWAAEVGGYMSLREHYIVDIRLHDGTELKTNISAIEPCSDIAVLGTPDTQVFYKEGLAFEEFCEKTTPIQMFDFSKDYSEFSIHIYTHENKWLTGKAEHRFPSSRIYYETKKPVKGGTSGSPIVNDSGELVGIVSNYTNHLDGLGPVPCLALPVWTSIQIEKGEQLPWA